MLFRSRSQIATVRLDSLTKTAVPRFHTHIAIFAIQTVTEVCYRSAHCGTACDVIWADCGVEYWGGWQYTRTGRLLRPDPRPPGGSFILSRATSVRFAQTAERVLMHVRHAVEPEKLARARAIVPYHRLRRGLACIVSLE